VVVVNFNSGDYLTSCIGSLLHSTQEKLAITVVDNASNDDSLKDVENRFPQVRIIRNQSNLGYSSAANLGFSRAKSKFVALINPDTFVDSRSLEGLVRAAERHPEGAFFQPKILLIENPHVLNSAGNMIHVAGFGVCRGIGMHDNEQFNVETEVNYASGACLLARMQAIREIGPLDETFLAYGEDKDWGWRALMKGWCSIYVPSSTVLHKWSPTLGASAEKFYLLEFERNFSVLKNYSKRTLALISLLLLMTEVSVLLYACVKGWLREKIHTYTDLVALRHTIAVKRAQIQRDRLVPDGILLGRFVLELNHPYIGSAGSVFNRIVSLLLKGVQASI
jgi:GT2 family glycosyltransferase